MTNMYNGDGPDGMPTAPYRAAAGSGGPGGTPRRSRAKQIGAVVLVCAAVGGGTFAVVEAVSSPASSGVSHTLVAAQAAQTSRASQAALLRSALTPAGRHRLVARLRALGGMYGQFTYDTKTGPRTLAFERGTVSSVTSGDVVVRAKDGTTETWELSGTSIVREDGTREPATALVQGQTVFAAGPVAGSTHDARLIVIRTTASS
jgi:hypothetical protein